MRRFGLMHPTEFYPVPPDTVQTALCVGSSNTQTFDWPTSTGGSGTNAGTVGAGIVRFTAQTTAGAVAFASVNLYSTGAGVPSSGTSISSSGVTEFFWGSATFQIPGNSTGWSAAALAVSAYVQAEIWSK